MRLSNFLHISIRNWYFCLFEGGKNIHFPARGSASGALAAFYQKISENTMWLTHGVWILCIFEQPDCISNVVACLFQSGLPPTPKPTGDVRNCSTRHNIQYLTDNLLCIECWHYVQWFPEKLCQPPNGLNSICHWLARRRTNNLHTQSGWILLRRIEKSSLAERAPNSRQMRY
jgi:hypothetical protein